MSTWIVIILKMRENGRSENFQEYRLIWENLIDYV